MKLFFLVLLVGLAAAAENRALSVLGEDGHHYLVEQNAEVVLEETNGEFLCYRLLLLSRVSAGVSLCLLFIILYMYLSEICLEFGEAVCRCGVCMWSSKAHKFCFFFLLDIIIIFPITHQY